MNDPNVPDAGSASAAPAGTPSAEERQWAIFAHLSALLGGLVSTGWGGSVGFFIGPLIIWQLKKDAMPFVNDQGKEALNFAITVSLLCLALVLLTLLTLGVGILLTLPLMAVIGLTATVLVVIAAIKANQGVAYRYPISLRLIK
jgi:hypothetical protein